MYQPTAICGSYLNPDSKKLREREKETDRQQGKFKHWVNICWYQWIIISLFTYDNAIMIMFLKILSMRHRYYLMIEW